MNTYYILIPREDFLEEFEANSISKQTWIGNYRVLRFKEGYGDQCLLNYKRLNDEEFSSAKAEIEESGFYNSKKTEQIKLSKSDPSGTSLIAVQKPSGDFNTIVTHNICDKDSWIVSTSDSTWELTPSENAVMYLDKAEAQFSHDLNISNVGNKTEIYLDYYVWHPASPGTPVLGQRIVVDTAMKLFELGNEHYHAPPLPEIPTGVTTIIFNYANKLTLYANETYGSLAKVVISTKDHIEPTGTYATVGFVTKEIKQ